MFNYEQIKKLSGLELTVYHYIIENVKAVQKMTIRELSEKSHVSTSTILRFCSKMNCEGFSELKYKLKEETGDSVIEQLYDPSFQVASFFKKITEASFEEALKQATKLICDAERVVFLGIGTSGILGAYGQRYFSNVAINSYSINDPFLPAPSKGVENSLIIALSVSGETTEVVGQVIDLKKSGAKILSITNAESSTLAKIADLNISYYMPDEYARQYDSAVNLTTQIPVVSLIEILAHRAEQELLVR